MDFINYRKRHFPSSTLIRPTITKDDGRMAVSSDVKVVVFVTHHLPTIPDVKSSLTEIIFEHLTTRHILDELNAKSATGTDGIPSLVQKKCAPELTLFICKLFSLCISTGTFPIIWDDARL